MTRSTTKMAVVVIPGTSWGRNVGGPCLRVGTDNLLLVKSVALMRYRGQIVAPADGVLGRRHPGRLLPVFKLITPMLGEAQTDTGAGPVVELCPGSTVYSLGEDVIGV